MTNIRLLRAAAACTLTMLTVACGLLDVSDPTQIEEADLTNASSAEMMRARALAQLYRGYVWVVLFGGTMADEFLSDATSSSTAGMSDNEAADRRFSTELEAVWTNSTTFTPYFEMASARFKASTAIPQLRAYGREELKDAYIGQMFAARGLVTLVWAEDFCPGVPLNEAVDGRVVTGAPRSTSELFEAALAEFDSAAAYAADSARILNFARIGRARALLGLGRFADAAAAVAAVPSEYVYNAEYKDPSAAQNYLSPGWLGSWNGVADLEGGTGLDYVSANDPRVAVVPADTAADGVTQLYALAMYPTTSSPIVLASGIEARLIEAEAALHNDDPSWLTILNDLRASRITPALPALTDPGTADARVDLLFRERAFWLFATGHRLGDLRRLIAYYGRGSETVFPTGAYHLGGGYESATSLPFPAALEARHNPAVTGCTSR